MKKLLPYVLLLSLCLQAQKKEKHWSDGPLTWKDFQEKDMELLGSKPDYYLTYRTEISEIEKNKISRIKSVAYLNTQTSSVSPLSKSSQILAYHQTEFDILEFYRRKFQTEIYQLSSSFDIQAKHKEITQQIGMTFSAFRQETNYGSNKRELNIWQKRFTTQLANSPADALPEIVYKNWGIGVFLGFDYGLLTNTLSNHLNNAPGMILGFETTYKKSYFLFNMSFLASKISNELTLGEFLEKNKKMNLIQIGLSYGYPIVDKSKFTITPFLGIGGTELLETSEEKDKFSKLIFSPNFGINLDYKFGKKTNLIPNLALNRNETNYFLRTRVYINKANFNENFKGNTFNLGLIFGMTTKAIKIKTID